MREKPDPLCADRPRPHVTGQGLAGCPLMRQDNERHGDAVSAATVQPCLGLFCESKVPAGQWGRVLGDGGQLCARADWPGRLIDLSRAERCYRGRADRDWRDSWERAIER